MDFRVHDATWLSDQPIGKVAASLWQSGVGFDYVSDRQLAQNISVRKGRLQSAGGQYSAIVVPRTEHIPPETMRRLLDLTRAGATLIFIDRLPPDVPGLSRLAQRRRELATMLRQISLDFPGADGMRAARVGRGRVLVGPNLAPLLAGVRREPMVDHPGVHFLRQRTMEGHVYFISNARGNALDGWVPLATRPAAVAIMDPLTGRSGLAELRTDTRGATEVYLQLASGSSLLLRAFDKPVAATRWAYRRPTSAPIAIRGQWTVRFVDGGPVLPAAFHSDLPVAWTGRGDADADRFAGTARYTLRFDAPSPDAASNYLLDLGLVASSARVRLNDRDAGVLFSRPFIIETGALRPTDNVLEIDVTNLSANRIKDLDVREVPWKIYRDINFVGIDYKPFDASKWPIRPAGLLGPVTLQPLESASPR